LKSVFAMIVLVILLYALFTVGLPFLLAILFAVLLEPVNSLLVRNARLPRAVAVTITCTLFLLLLLGIFALMGIKIISQFQDLWSSAPHYINETSHYIRDAIARTELLYETLPPDVAQQIQAGLDYLTASLVDAAKSVLGAMSGSFLNLIKMIPNAFVFLIVFLVALYLFCWGLPRFKGAVMTFFHEDSKTKVEQVFSALHKSIFGFLKAQVFLSLMTYVITLAGFLLLKVKYALAIALLVVIVDILPILGVGSVLVPWSVFSLLSSNLTLGIGLLVLFIVITVVRRTIEPKVLGNSVGIGAIPALVSLYVGFELVGVVGLFLGPVVIIIFQAMRRAGLMNIKIRLE